MFELTVIIPSHNKADYIVQCLDSILNQSLKVKEIIVFDDCSTDNTMQVLKDYQKKCSCLKVIESKQNVGVSVARDKAIKCATTEYVTFIDADDFYWDINKLKREMKLAQDYFDKTGNYCCTYSQTVLVDENGDRIDNLEIRDWDKHIRVGTITRLYKYWLPRDYCFPKALYLKVGGFDPKLNLYEDWDLNLRLFAESSFLFSGVFGTAYRLNTGGLSSADNKRHLRMKKLVFYKNKKTLRISSREQILFELLLYGAYLKKAIKYNWG